MNRIGCPLLRVISLVLFAAAQAPASVLHFVGDPDPKLEVQVGEIKVPVYREAEVRVPETDTWHRVYLTGRGVRYKVVFFVKLPVYVAISYVSNPPIAPTDPMGTIAGSSVKVMHMTSLMDLSADQIRSETEEALDVNGVDLYEPSMAALLDEFDFELNTRANGILVGFNMDGEDSMYIEAPEKTIHQVGPDLSFNFWRVWFGIPMDNGIDKLREQLVKLPQVQSF